MFYEMHDESLIGLKVLSDADLGISKASSQTHIGLSDRLLTFLSDPATEDVILLYDNEVHHVTLYFDKIHPESGGSRSPKARIGESSSSLVAKIRALIKSDLTQAWYLLYFALSNSRIVFFLFKESSKELSFLTDAGKIPLKKGWLIIAKEDISFDLISTYFLKSLEKANYEELKELESFCEGDTKETTPGISYRQQDIERMNEKCRENGRAGEKHIFRYFEALKSSGRIKSVEWPNEEKESTAPYDFKVVFPDDTITYIDVKSTSFNFDQPINLSAGELSFISDKLDGCEYAIYRVYDLNCRPSLRICNSVKTFAKDIFSEILRFKDALRLKSISPTISIKFPPDKLPFAKEVISLDENDYLDD